MATRFFRLKDDAGDHYERSDAHGGILTYRPGDVVESEQNLMAMNPNKFKEVNPKSPRAKDKYHEEEPGPNDIVPVRGLPTKRTRRPLGPEETPNTEEEIFEVDAAMESEDTEENPQTYRGNKDRNKTGQGPNLHRGSKALLKHQKKMGRISDEAETEEIEDDSEYDEEDEVEGEYNKFKPVKSRSRTVEEGRPKGETEEEDEDTIESEDDEEVVTEEEDDEEEEAPRKKKKMKSGKSKKKSKKNRE